MLTGAWASNEHASQKYNCPGRGEAVAYSMQMIGVNHIQPCPRLQKYNPNAVSAKVQPRKVETRPDYPWRFHNGRRAGTKVQFCWLLIYTRWKARASHSLSKSPQPFNSGGP
jgi:hypothetical protein